MLPLAQGKVCLSLLGTFHGTDASQKWSPAESSLYQLLMSVLGLIFVNDPYFAEPVRRLSFFCPLPLNPLRPRP